MTPSLAVSIGVSGAFLCDVERFHKIRRLSAELRTVRAQLCEVEARLRNCNDPDWLFRFGNACQRRRCDPKESFPALAEKLGADRVRLGAQMEELRRKLLELEPTFPLTAHSLLQFGPRATRRMKDPAVAARDAVIDARLDHPAPAICEILDQEFPFTGRPAPELPDRWFRDFGVKTFVQAYRKCPNRVRKMISVRRRKCVLP